MANKFVSVLEHIGQEFQKGLKIILPYAETVGAVAVEIFFPALGPAYNSTVGAIAMAEQKYTALGKQSGSGPQKLADVLNIVQPVVAQALADAGKANDQTAVINYINSVVNILNSIPQPKSGEQNL
jgi:hypothetical protein